jgi:hypothetical protein
MLVRKVQGLANLSQDEQGFIYWQWSGWSPIESVAQGTMCSKLGNDIWQPFIDIGINEWKDMGML